MKKLFGKILAVASVFGFTMANAAIDVSTVTLDVTPVESLGIKILGALAVIWVTAKVIGFMRR